MEIVKVIRYVCNLENMHMSLLLFVILHDNIDAYYLKHIFCPMVFLSEAPKLISLRRCFYGYASREIFFISHLLYFDCNNYKI